MWPLSSGALARRFVRARRLLLIAVIAAVELAASGQAAPTIAPAASDRQPHPPAGLTPQCLLCHESDLITQQKLSRAAWSRELDKMIRWGAVVAPDERERMLDALATIKPIADKYKASFAQLAINWTIHEPGISAALVGARNAEQATHNAGAMNFLLTDSERKQIRAAFDGIAVMQ